MVEKSGVEKFMVEKSGVEKSGVEAWGWKVQGWDVLQPFARLKWGDRFYYDLANQKGSFDQCNVFHFYSTKVILII